GMEQQFRFDITSAASLKTNNVLAVEIYPPNHPGKPANEPLTPLADPGTNMADGVISKDYTKWDVMGWDWQPSIRDRDTGITDDVFISATDPIELVNLYMTSKLPLPDTISADLTISTDLINHSSQTKSGKIKANVSKGNTVIALEQSFTVKPNDTLHIFWNKDNMPKLHLKNPKLWWPNGYGKPELYTLELKANTEKDEHTGQRIRFGIREVETYIGAKERVYKINGQDIYCKGGNWVIDMMLNWTAKRYEDEILLTKKSNLNMLRIWGPTGVPPEVFYEAADENGILLWQDFLHDFWGTFRNKEGFRPEISLFEKATTSIVKKYRNHPSLVIWCGGNEGVNPREDLIVNKILPKYDGRDSKFYLKSSNGDGMHGGGPYNTLEPKDYFTNPKLSGFSSEIGPSGVPVFESVVKFMPDLGKSWMVGRFPIDGVWAYHDANDWPGKDTRKFSSYDNMVRNYYGSSDSTSLAGAEDYLNKCQLVNYDVYQASIEAVSSQLWKNSSGILLWKSNSSWPSITWQIYDWYLQAHAGYYATKKAAAPVCVQFNRKSMKVEVVNANLKEINQANATAILYTEGMKPIWNTSEKIDLQKNSAVELKDVVPVTSEICFLKLELKNQKGETLADNLYWLSTSNNFKALSSIPEPELMVQSKKTVSKDKVRYQVLLSNDGKTIALMTELKLTDGKTGLEILPSYWSDNYVSLLPGEKKSVQVEVDPNNLPDNIVLKYKAFNMNTAKLVQP
ncbi:MAG TPA: glycoside hydrolase family 2 protein, partial [Prolixibacteraceae bacterium]